MWINHVFLGFLGLVFGVSIASATFALAVKLGIIPEMADKSRTARHIMIYENVTILGGIVGNMISVFLNIRLPLGPAFLVLYGTGAGVYVGCLAVALAEIINVFPILFRRLKIRTALNWVICSVALGKLSGCLYYFIKGLAKPG